MTLATEGTTKKKPHRIGVMLGLIRETLKPYPKAMLFELAERGYESVFQQLLACLISIRTLDEVSLPVSLALLERARTPEELLGLEEEEIVRLIERSTFARQKAGRMRQIATIAITHYNGEIPCEFDALTDLPGVGPKCANLVLGIACQRGAIGVDIHVHRITNRWGYVAAATPERTLKALEEKLPREHWVEINELLVPFGKHVCTGRLPRCSSCPVLAYCQQVGVTKLR